jgi:hypothetical protein
MANKIFILRDFAWEFNDGEPMSYRGFGEFYKKFDTYQAAFEQKKEAEIAIAQRGHENFDQLSGKVPYHEGIEKYWEYIKIHLSIDAKAILESNFVQQMQDSWKDFFNRMTFQLWMDNGSSLPSSVASNKVVLRNRFE